MSRYFGLNQLDVWKTQCSSEIVSLGHCVQSGHALITKKLPHGSDVIDKKNSWDFTKSFLRGPSWGFINLYFGFLLRIHKKTSSNVSTENSKKNTSSENSQRISSEVRAEYSQKGFLRGPCSGMQLIIVSIQRPKQRTLHYNSDSFDSLDHQFHTLVCITGLGHFWSLRTNVIWVHWYGIQKCRVERRFSGNTIFILTCWNLN